MNNHMRDIVMPKTSITDTEFVKLLNRDNALFALFKGYSSSKKPSFLNSMGGYWYPLIPGPRWSEDYEVKAVRKKAEEVDKKLDMLSVYIHALGLMETLESDSFRSAVGSVIT